VTAKPPVVVELSWQRELRFQASVGSVAVEIDGDGGAALSPARPLRARLGAERAAGDPHRLVKVELHFSLVGNVPPDRVQRAIDLSRQTYCSVWHSLRQDIEFTTSFDLSP
jgi:putative redox protein